MYSLARFLSKSILIKIDLHRCCRDGTVMLLVVYDGMGRTISHLLNAIIALFSPGKNTEAVRWLSWLQQRVARARSDYHSRMSFLQ